MNKLDLIIDALLYAKNDSLSYEVWNRIDKALAAARELRALKPVAWVQTWDGNTHKYVITETSPEIRLYALGESND